MPRSAFREFIATEYGHLPKPQGKAQGPRPEPIPPPPGVLAAPEATSGPRLPDFKLANQIIPAQVITPALLVDGLLHRGCKLLLAGGSKSFKSWVLMDLALSIAEGIPWWGMACRRGRVLYINFELIEPFFEQRLMTICKARGVNLPQSFIYWGLRGHCYDLAVLADVIVSRVGTYGAFDFIVVDPIYKALGDLDENSASDMTKLMNLIETITIKTGAAVAFGSHFSKGNQAGKEAKDRPSGSGVLIRDPDAIMTLTRHKEEHCYVVNSELRYLPPAPEIVVRWMFPLMQQDESLDPRQLYIPGETENGRPATKDAIAPFSEVDILDCLPIAGAQDTLWRKQVIARFNKSGTEYYQIKAELIKKGLVIRKGQIYYRTNLKFEQPR